MPNVDTTWPRYRFEKVELLYFGKQLVPEQLEDQFQMLEVLLFGA